MLQLVLGLIGLLVGLLFYGFGQSQFGLNGRVP